MQHWCPVTLDVRDLLVRSADRFEFGEVAVTVLVEGPWCRADQIVGSDEIGFTRIAEPFLSPAAIAGHDVIDLLVRQLCHQNAYDDAAVDHRCCHEGGRGAARW